MIKFNNDLVEKVCEQILSPKEMELKITQGGNQSYMIFNDKDGLKLLLQQKDTIVEQLHAIERAITITEVAIKLEANKLDDEE